MTNGKRVFNANINSNGCDDFNVNIYADDALETLREVYSKIGGLYTFGECEAEFGNTFDFNADDYESLKEIISL